MIVVRGKDQSLTVQRRIHPRQYSDHVPGRQSFSTFAGHGEWLEVAILGARAGYQRRKTEPLETFRDVARCGIKAAAAGTAPLTLGRSQPFDIGLHTLAVERRPDLGQRLPGSK